MKIIFLTLAYIDSLEDRGIYPDLMRKFRDEGHDITIVCPVERRHHKPTRFFEKDGIRFLHVKTLNVQKTNFIEKGISTISIEAFFTRAIKKYLNTIRFDLVLYSTPPITFTNVIRYLKKKNQSITYLLLKDIFPQNAVDLKMLSSNNPIYHYFRRKEKLLYQNSDFIGCMSPANVTYLLKHNKNLTKDKVHVNPNAIEPTVINERSDQEIQSIKSKYSLPLNKKIFLYGGNIGKPQGIDFLLDTIKTSNNPEAFFLIIGSGTEFPKLMSWFQQYKPKNAQLIESLPKKEFDVLLSVSDVGLIFLHKDFTIPNFPSRLLSYLEYGKPVISATDPNTDIGKIIVEYGCGFSVLSGDLETMHQKIDYFCKNNFDDMKSNAKHLLQEKYLVKDSYNIIMDKILP